jgi:hypothetical protein
MNQFEKFKAEIAEIQNSIFSPITTLIESAEDDATKYYTKGVRSAGNRLKKKMQEIRKAIKHPVVKSRMTEIQNKAKDYRQTLVDETKTTTKA